MEIMDRMRFPVRKKSCSGQASLKAVFTVGLIGALVKFVIPMAAGAVDMAKDARDLSNARLAVSLCATADAAGHDFVEERVGVLGTLIRLSKGTRVEEGIFRGSHFQLPLTIEEALAAEQFLEIQDGMLVLKDKRVESHWAFAEASEA